ncbi:MAG: NAD-glutamate dehydrogenase [Silvanigrellaceae bacterium]|nr:NAD-glutamate dehydrogenase [Silvanigrellaceae bacterium]
MNITTEHDNQWLREVELLDSELETVNLSSEMKNENIQSPFPSLSAPENFINEILKELKSELEKTLPWFLQHMPLLYLHSTTFLEKMDNVLEIVAGKIFENNQEVIRKNSQDLCVTLIAPGEKASVLLGSMLSNYPGKALNLFTSNDKRAALCKVFQSSYFTENNWDTNENALKRKQIEHALKDKPAERVEGFLNLLDKDFFKTATVKQIVIAFEVMDFCLQNESNYVKLTIVNHDQSNTARLDIGIKNFPLNIVAENIIAVFNRFKYQVLRILGAEFKWPENNDYFTICSVIIARENSEFIEENSKIWGKAVKTLKTLSFVDHGDMFTSLIQGQEPMSLNEVNLIRSMANWTHIFLTKRNPYYYSLERVSKVFINHPVFNEYAIRYFRAKFDPRFKDDRVTAMQNNLELCLKTVFECVDSVEKTILNEGLNFLKNILKTNYFFVTKRALSFRLSPEVLNKEDYPETPYGIFYMVGRNFRAFQVRYRDIARGGVRVVLPRNQADYDSTLAGLFDEVNGLASAQQLKNKDIPEGGSKCVIVVSPTGNRHEAVKSTISSLLDLINLDGESGQGTLDPAIIDYYKKDEIIFLGPDENLTDDLINWIIRHALRRNYRYAYAFMSSKPEFGINHKTYGVTSEGLNVYLDNVLSYLNMKNTPFRIKMTGGPDGDVAGNELKILYREYGEKARVVAIADGFGAAYDPQGLNWQELLRLVKYSKSIVEFRIGNIDTSRDNSRSEPV